MSEDERYGDRTGKVTSREQTSQQCYWSLRKVSGTFIIVVHEEAIGAHFGETSLQGTSDSFSDVKSVPNIANPNRIVLKSTSISTKLRNSFTKQQAAGGNALPTERTLACRSSQYRVSFQSCLNPRVFMMLASLSGASTSRSFDEA